MDLTQIAPPLDGEEAGPAIAGEEAGLAEANTNPQRKQGPDNELSSLRYAPTAKPCVVKSQAGESSALGLYPEAEGYYATAGLVPTVYEHGIEKIVAKVKP